MPNFIVNKNAQPNGDHEVHNSTAGCTKMPLQQNQIQLGAHTSCVGAVLTAKSLRTYARVNGCYYCCNACHTS